MIVWCLRFTPTVASSRKTPWPMQRRFSRTSWDLRELSGRAPSGKTNGPTIPLNDNLFRSVDELEIFRALAELPSKR